MPRRNKKSKTLIECSNDYFYEVGLTAPTALSGDSGAKPNLAKEQLSAEKTVSDAGTPQPAAKIATNGTTYSATNPAGVRTGEFKGDNSINQPNLSGSTLKGDGSGVTVPQGDSFAAQSGGETATDALNGNFNQSATTDTSRGDQSIKSSTPAGSALGGSDAGAVSTNAGSTAEFSSGDAKAATKEFNTNTVNDQVSPTMPGSKSFKPTNNNTTDNAILLSKLLPTEAEIRTIPKAYLKMFKDMIHNCGLTEAMIQEATKNYIPQQFLASQELAKEVLKDPINATKISVIVEEGSKSFNSVNDALNLMSLLGDAAEHNAKVSNDTLSSALKGFGEVANTGIRSMQKLINENADWLSIVMSKPLNQWNIAFSETPMKNWKCSQLFTLCAVLSSVVFTCHKILSSIDKASLSTNTVENNVKKLKLIKSALKESKAVFGGISHLIEAGLGVNAKLSKYADGKIPTNVILINSMILKAGKPAKDLLARVISEKDPDTTVDKSISINKPFYTLCTYAASFVLLWIKIAGMYIKNADDVNIVSNMMSDKIRSKIDPSEKNVLKSLFGGLQSKLN